MRSQAQTKRIPVMPRRAASPEILFLKADPDPGLSQPAHRIHRNTVLCQLKVNVGAFHAIVHGWRSHFSHRISGYHHIPFCHSKVRELSIGQLIAISCPSAAAVISSPSVAAITMAGLYLY